MTYLALGQKYRGRIAVGHHSNALASFAALQSLLAEAAGVAPAGLSVTELKAIAGHPSSEGATQFTYRFDNGEVAPQILIEVKDGKIGKWRVVKGE
jgi:hypothetical protein